MRATRGAWLRRGEPGIQAGLRPADGQAEAPAPPKQPKQSKQPTRTTRRAWLAGLGAAAVFPSCNRTPEGGSRQIVIGVSLLNLSSEFIVMLDRAMEAKSRELGVRLIVNDAQRDAAT
jgi:hypothetical protein